MRFVLASAAKLNLSLRVTARREDGYHDIVSLFLRLPSVEALGLSRAHEADAVRVSGMEIAGENIVSRALRFARDAGFRTPHWEVAVLKNLAPGSGLGAGSGNAAAVLRFIADESAAWSDVALRTGADVPFLFSGHPAALVSGIGEVLEPLEPVSLYASVAFPDWSVGTENAYSQLDRRCALRYPLDAGRAREEALGLYDALRSGRTVGPLPNDFLPGLVDAFPDYRTLFGLFEAWGSCAWGITGSGGAAFALHHQAPDPEGIAWPGWVRQVLSVRT